MASTNPCSAQQHFQVAIRNTFLDFSLVTLDGDGEHSPLQHRLVRSMSAPELSFFRDECTKNTEENVGEVLTSRDLTFDSSEEDMSLSSCESHTKIEEETTDIWMLNSQRRRLHLPSLLTQGSKKKRGKRRTSYAAPSSVCNLAVKSCAADAAVAYLIVPLFLVVVPTEFAYQGLSLFDRATSAVAPLHTFNSSKIALLSLDDRIEKKPVVKEVRRDSGTHHRTTVMLRNLPDGFTRDILLRTLDEEGFAGKYNFVYVPIDFRNHISTGYAFINMVTAGEAAKIMRRFNGFVRWPVACNQPCFVCWSDPYQGLEANVARYRNSPLMHHVVPNEYRPAIFRDGVRVEFPPPTRVVKAPRKGTQRMLIL